MQRRRISTGVFLISSLLAGSTFPSRDFDPGCVRADDAPSLPPVQPAATIPPKPAASKQRSKIDKSQITQLRTQRAQARRAAVALDDQYGPGAASFAASQAGWGSNAQVAASGGGSLGFGGPSGLGNYAGTGSSLGSSTSTGFGASSGSNAGAGSAATGTTGQSGNTSTEAPDLNAKVLEFAVQNIGKQVGNGQCWTLGSEALAYAGAEPPRGYVFGDVVPLAQALPGDILQFYNAHFVGIGYWMILGGPNHTAIVQSVNGNTITMLNQDVNHVLRIQTSVINMADFVSGTVTVYRPVARTSR